MKDLNKNRVLFYLTGMIFLALGLTLNTKADMGISPIMSCPFVVSRITGLALADVTLASYVIFIAVELIVHRIKKKRRSYFILDLAQLPFSLVFTRFMALYGLVIPSLSSEDMLGTAFGSVPFRILVVILAIIFTGIGAILMLDMALIPNPGDGIVQALASLIQKDIPYTKLRFDCFCLCTTIAISLLSGRGLIGINIGTILTILGVSRVMKVFNSIFLDKLNQLTQ